MNRVKKFQYTLHTDISYRASVFHPKNCINYGPNARKYGTNLCSELLQFSSNNMLTYNELKGCDAKNYSEDDMCD